jgi:hypothetical protein
MTPEFLAAVVATLLPGAGADARRLPPASQAGVTLEGRTERFLPVLRCVVELSGGAAGFVQASQEARVAILEAVESATGSQFRRLVIELLQDYCESEAALVAMGSPTDPPQPRGRDVAPTDEATLELLATVRRRGPIWR